VFTHPAGGDASAWWTLFGAQLVHPTPGVALLDLGLLGLASAWLELRERGTLLAVLLGGALAVAGVVGVAAAGPSSLTPDVLQRFEGSSGLAHAVLAAAAMQLALRGPAGPARRLGTLVLAAVLLKATLEQAAGWHWSAGLLPPGARVFPAVHLAGALAGSLVALGPSLRRGVQRRQAMGRNSTRMA